MENTKSQEQRLLECLQIRKQMVKLGIDILPEFEPIYPIMNDFIRHGIPATGSIPLPSAQRTAIYVFTNEADIVSFMKLKYTPHMSFG